jgi:putative membrane protein (TIGR04086 family)
VRLKPWPIVVGIVVDAVFSMMVVIAYVLLLALTEGTDDALRVVPRSDALAGTVEALGVVSTALGGFVAAYLAKTSHVAYGLAVGLGSLLVWLALASLMPGGGPMAWLEATSAAAAVPAGALGGYVAARRARQKPAARS